MLVSELLFRCDEVGGIARSFMRWGRQTLYKMEVVGDLLQLLMYG